MRSLVEALPWIRETTVIRRFRASDATRFHAYRSNADLARYQGWSPMDMPGARRFVREMEPILALRPGGWVQLAIAESPSDELVGDLGLYLEADESAGEIGFTLSLASQGQGHATHAVEVGLSLLFGTSAVPEVRAVVDARNEPAVRLLERTGFERVASRRALFKGEVCTEFVYMRQRS
jgi:aminoglycoside 6'-N-acetyltransferase